MNTTTTQQISIQTLLDHDLIHAESWAKVARKATDFNAILRGDAVATEPKSTLLLSLTHGRLERAIVDHLLDAANIHDVDRCKVRILTGSNLRFDSNAPDRRTIDLILAILSSDGDMVCGGKVWDLVLAVEAKYGAAVNGNYGYCPNDKEGYSNQIICYAPGCVDDRLNIDNVEMLWLCNPPRNDIRGPWGDQGITGREKDPRIIAALEVQDALRGRWSMATWAGLGKAIEDAIGGPEGESISAFIQQRSPIA